MDTRFETKKRAFRSKARKILFLQSYLSVEMRGCFIVKIYMGSRTTLQIFHYFIVYLYSLLL